MRRRLASGQRRGPFRMLATTLGEYLLYGARGEFLGSGLVSGADARSLRSLRSDVHAANLS